MGLLSTSAASSAPDHQHQHQHLDQQQQQEDAYADHDEKKGLLKGKAPRPWASPFLRSRGLHVLFAFCLVCTAIVVLGPLLSAWAASRPTTSYGSYFMGPSTIPGAGLGVFAKQDMPAGTVWNAEDAKPASVVVLGKMQWTSIMGLANYLKDAGYPAHPIIHMVTFFDTYGYPCSNDCYVVSLSASTFANHAPEAAPQPAPLPPGGRQQLQQPQAATAARLSPFALHANSGGLPDDAPWVKKLSVVEQCVLSITLRDIKAGEEILEDYRRYCDEGESCGDLGMQPDSDAYIDDDDAEQPPRRRSRALLSEPSAPDTSSSSPGTAAAAAASAVHGISRSLAQTGFGAGGAVADDDDDDEDEPGGVFSKQLITQLPGVQIANSSAPRTVATGLGLFAARDISAGTIWNKADAEHSLVITRGQWDTLLRMQANLRALHVNKPIVNNMIDALRTLGYCCPRSGALYVPLTDSLFANMGQRQASHKAPGSSSWRISARAQALGQARATPLVNSQLVAHGSSAAGDSDKGLNPGSRRAVISAQQACTWSRALHDIRRGEEILDDRRSHSCSHWPGFHRIYA